MKRFLFLFIAILTLGFFYFFPSRAAHASEGTVELQSTTGQASRCLVTSVLMTDLNYTLLTSCRDLIYPPAVDLFTYVVWSSPLQAGQKSVRLGELAFGKSEFRTNLAFSSLFVTAEQTGGVNSPSGIVVMQGQVQPVIFLAGPPKPTITPSPAEEIKQPAPTPTATKSGTLLSGVRRVLIIVLIVILVFVIIATALVLLFRRLSS